MHVFTSADSTKWEPDGHFGHLEVADIVPREQGDNFVIQLSHCPPGGGGHKHHHDDQAQVFIVTRGQLTFDTDEGRFTLHAPDAVLFAPGEPHATINESDEESLTVVVTVDRRGSRSA
jgi:quercetin dioxygenase-like cupin family protein